MLFDSFRLDGKVAVITGAGRGIGAETARVLAEAGADVVIGARTAAQLEEVAAEVRALGRKAVVVAGDLGRRDGLAELARAAADQLGRIDVVVNNVGGSYPSPFLATSEKDFNHAFHWNVTTAFNLTQIAVPHLVKSGGGSIVNVASAAGRFRERGFTAYSTAKSALMHMTRNLAADLAPRIRVNAVAPGAIMTPALEGFVRDERVQAQMLAKTPLRRFGEARDIALGILYLASPASSYVTGKVLEIDGGTEANQMDLGIPDVG